MNRIVIEVKSGMVTAAYGNTDTVPEIMVLDLDLLAIGDCGSTSKIPVEPASQMSGHTWSMAEKYLKNK